ncbi:MAG: V-type ATP synthase subunit D [Clostridiales bacterium]|nr:V-type ATP synthase subunit D [Clostridiales bacterium]
MAEQVFPTKGNLMKIKKSLELARTGFDLLDRKRNILVRETMALIDTAKEIQSLINVTYAKAYEALQAANVTLGLVDEMAAAIPVEHGLSIGYRSVMGVEIPSVGLHPTPRKNYFGYQSTSVQLDEAYARFDDVKRLTARLAEIENGVYRLAQGIRKTQKRANALKNIMIPRFETQVKFITDALEEKEREEFSRLKVIKKTLDA